MFTNPFDISKDGNNAFVDGIRYHMRESEQNKEMIKKYIEKFFIYYLDFDTSLSILKDVERVLHIDKDSLIITDEHEILDWIFEKMSKK